MSEPGVFTGDNGEVEFTLYTGILQTFDSAERFCEGLGGTLARISNEAEFSLVEDIVQQSQTLERIWIGNISLNTTTILSFF